MRIYLMIIASCLAASPLFSAEASTATVTLTAVGDVLLGYKMMEAKIKEHGVNYAFEKIASRLREADLTICNFESCISTMGAPIKKKQFTFRCNPRTIEALKYAGIDAVNLANNHAGDYGRDALRDTLKYLEKENMPYFGAVKRAPEPDRGVVLERNGVKVGFLGFTSVFPKQFWFGKKAPGLVSSWPEDGLAERIRELRKRADVVVVSFHWGNENMFYPDINQIYLARFALDKGADIVIGHHPHVMEGIEIYKGKPILYSMGNFIFFPPKEIGKETIIAEFTVNKQGKTLGIKIEPVYIDDGQPHIPLGAKGREIIEKYYLLCRSLGTGAAVDAASNTLSVHMKEDSPAPNGYSISLDTRTLKLIDENGKTRSSFNIYPGPDFPDKGKHRILYMHGAWDRDYRFDKDGVAPVNADREPWFFYFSTAVPSIGLHGISDDVIVKGEPYPGSIGMSKADIETLKQYVYMGMSVSIKTSRLKVQALKQKTQRKPAAVNRKTQRNK